MDLKFLETKLKGIQVSRATSGSLAGHAAGEPFDNATYQLLKSQFPNKIFRQHEFLNKLFIENPKAISYEDRMNLFHSPTLAFLLNRGIKSVSQWSITNQFEEKQNDTADILLIDDLFFQIIDIKTKNLAKEAQPPNIISAYKLAQMCAIMIDNEDFDKFDITYVGINWSLEKDVLRSRSAVVRELFKADPSTLYINWSAALQIQFHVEELSQSYDDVKDWCFEYLHKFVESARNRTNHMAKTFIKPFEKY